MRRAFRDLIARTGAAGCHVEVHSFVERAAGPHPTGSFEVLFTREAYVEFVTWLQLNRPDALSIMIHPLTRVQLDDRTRHALWLGRQLALDPSPLVAMDAKYVASDRSDEDIIDAVKKH